MRSKSMNTFLIIWSGQLISLLGTGMTRFALLTWAYKQTGDATTLALLGFFSFAPYILMSPLAGVLVDRWDRRLVMLFADLGAGLLTVMLLILFTMGGLQIWHLYLAEALVGVFEAFQLPAYSAATTVLVPKAHYSRVSGMRSLAYAVSQIFAPFMAGLVLAAFDIGGVMLIDIVTFIAAMLTLLIVRIPRPAVSQMALERQGMWREMAFGLRYITARRGLLGLLLIFVGVNLFASLTYFSILPAMVLARSGGDELALAGVYAGLGIGGIVGGLIVSVWGGPRRRIHGALAFTAVSFLLGDLLFAVGRTTPAWMLAGFLAAAFIPFITGAERAIWQVKVPPDVQGRVFSIQNTLQWATRPVGYLLAGPLADGVFEPAMAVGGSLADGFGWLVGAGPGAGMALMFVCTAAGGTLISISGYLFRVIRRVEIDLPDYDAVTAPEGPEEMAIRAA